MDDGTKVRTNGFERPFHPLQVLSWVVFGSDVLIYLAFCLPLIDTVGAKVLVAVVYIASVVTLVFFTVKATSCDPADPHVHLDSSQVKAEDMQTMPYCTVCNVPVHSRSKHCRVCNKCVSVFDHHCMWLNNCIGEANYRAFFTTVSAVAVMIGIVLGTCLYLLVDYFASHDEFQDRVESMAFYKAFPTGFYLGLLLTMMFVNVPLFVLDMQLVLLHLFLMSQHLTTYEYIVNKRQQGSDETRVKLGQRIKTLPHCMDWIVFSRCGQKRRKKRKNGIERIATCEDPEDTKAQQAAPKAAAGGPQASVEKAAEHLSPPGSTLDAAALESGEGGPATPSHINGMEVDSQMGCDCAASSPRSSSKQPAPPKE